MSGCSHHKLELMKITPERPELEFMVLGICETIL